MDSHAESHFLGTRYHGSSGIGDGELCVIAWQVSTKTNACVFVTSAQVSRPCVRANHLEERLLDQAQARASYTPLFWGHSRSIPQGMILDVQPLVKSLFCPIRASPNGFFDFEASTP